MTLGKLVIGGLYMSPGWEATCVSIVLAFTQ